MRLCHLVGLVRVDKLQHQQLVLAEFCFCILQPTKAYPGSLRPLWLYRMLLSILRQQSPTAVFFNVYVNLLNDKKGSEDEAAETA